jgi:hypothetical protein
LLIQRNIAEEEERSKHTWGKKATARPNWRRGDGMRDILLLDSFTIADESIKTAMWVGADWVTRPFINTTLKSSGGDNVTGHTTKAAAGGLRYHLLRNHSDLRNCRQA